ncbi:MAG: isoprenyl transferase [Methylococcales bacterium]|nr:isoprenyl transferase [Methylococcales bacterium]
MIEKTIENGQPKHIAIILDGNGRWAEKKSLPRFMGHNAGVKAVRKIVEACVEEDIAVLSLFAFSSENWRRPRKEVQMLMELFLVTLKRQIDRLDKNNIRLRIIGDKTAFSEKLQARIADAEQQTQNNTGMDLIVAANYGGHWDITQAVQKIATKIVNKALDPQEITEDLITQHTAIADLPDPDLFIRTGGEKRISNFLLWQLAYTEFYFTDTLWPDFDKTSLLESIESFKGRQRRFGQTSEQVTNS